MSKISKLHYTGWIPDKWLDDLVEAVNSMQSSDSGEPDTSEIESLVQSLIDSKIATLTGTVSTLSSTVEDLGTRVETLETTAEDLGTKTDTLTSTVEGLDTRVEALESAAAG